MSFAQWVADMRWAANAKRARKWRRRLSFSGRIAFDQAIRPKVKSGVIDYPDALYHITIDDLTRAMIASAPHGFDR